MKAQIAIIGGTGFESALVGRFGRPPVAEEVRTDYGNAAVQLFAAPGGAVAFLPRHGVSHAIAPHKINHRANIAALRQLGAATVFSTSAVGALRQDFEPGDVCVIDDFIDLRGGAPTTLFDHGSVVHTDFSEPIGARARGILLNSVTDACDASGVSGSIIHPCGVYLCLNGPRYETPAEVRLFGAWGADVVGMTVAPEAILAREAGLEYASLSVITNFGTGLSETPLAHADVARMMEARRPLVVDALLRACAILLEIPSGELA